MGPVPLPFPPRHDPVHNGHWTAVLGPPPEPQDRPRGICGKPGYWFRRYGRSRRCHPYCAGFACAAFPPKPTLHRVGKFRPFAFSYLHVDSECCTQRFARPDADAHSDAARLGRANYSRGHTRSACGTCRTRTPGGSTSGPRGTAGAHTRRARSTAGSGPGSGSGNKRRARRNPWRLLPQCGRRNARGLGRRQHLRLRRQRPRQEWPLPLELIRGFGAREDQASHRE